MGTHSIMTYLSIILITLILYPLSFIPKCIELNLLFIKIIFQLGNWNNNSYHFFFFFFLVFKSFAWVWNMRLNGSYVSVVFVIIIISPLFVPWEHDSGLDWCANEKVHFQFCFNLLFFAFVQTTTIEKCQTLYIFHLKVHSNLIKSEIRLFIFLSMWYRQNRVNGIVEMHI